MFKKLKKLPLNKQIFLLGLISFFADISSEMLYPITPLFLTQVLGATPAALGIIEGVAECAASFFKTFSGVWSDKISKRRPFIFLGYFFSALAKPLIGFATIWPHVLAARVFDRLGKGIRSAPRDALLADSSLEVNHAFVYGWHRGMDSAGACLGPIIGLFLLSLFSSNIGQLYFFAFIPGAISAFIVFFIREPKKIKNFASNASNTKVDKKIFFLPWKQMHPSFKKFILIYSLFALFNSSDAFLILKAKDLGFSFQKIIGVYCLYNFVLAISGPVMGTLADKIGRKKIFYFSLMIFAITYLGFSQVHNGNMLFLLFPLYGLFGSAHDSSLKAMAVGLLPKEWKGAGLGILGTVTGLGVLFANIFGGLIWVHFGSTYLFLLGVLGSILCLTSLLFFNSVAK